MMHPGMPWALSPRAMAELRGAPVSGLGGLGRLPTGQRPLPGPAGNKPTATPATGGSGRPQIEIGSGGFKAKVLKADDLLLVRQADEAELCAEKPGAPGLRPRVCTVIDDAAVRMKSDGNDALKTLTYLSGAPEGKAISSVPYDMYTGSPGTMAEEYAALYTLARYSNAGKTAAPKANQTSIPLLDLISVLEESNAEGIRYFDTKTVDEKIVNSLDNQQIAWESANRQQLDANVAAKTQEERREELRMKTDKDDAARQQEAAKADAARKQMLLMVGGGVAVVGVIAFVALRKR